MAKREVIGALASVGDLLVTRSVCTGAANMVVFAAGQDEHLEFLWAWFVKTNAAQGAQTLTLADDALNAITDAMDVNDADTVVSQPIQIDDDYAPINPGEGVTANFNNAAGNTGILYCLFLRTTP